MIIFLLSFIVNIFRSHFSDEFFLFFLSLSLSESFLLLANCLELFWMLQVLYQVHFMTRNRQRKHYLGIIWLKKEKRKNLSHSIWGHILGFGPV